jgi:hypothetical protein
MIIKRLKIYIGWVRDFLSSMHSLRTATILSKKDTVAFANNKSLIRFGDGETIIISGGGIHYQSANKRLADELAQTVQEYIGQAAPRGGVKYGYTGIVCMPKEFLELSPLGMISNLSSNKYWVGFRRFFKDNWDKKVVYGNSFVFAKNNEPYYRLLWAEKKYIVFVHNDKVYADNFADRYEIHTDFVYVPPENAYESIDRTFLEVTEFVENSEYDIHDIAVLISAGPAGKALAVRLSKRGIQAIDAGHCWDGPLNV